MRLPEGFLDELRARTPLSAVIGRRVRLIRSGRDWKGCCPFHGEKSPSFHVYADHFHCFGCGAHGDAVAFVMQSQGASFMEAVEQLASEAGLEMPRPTAEDAEGSRRRLDLAAVLTAATTHYSALLHAPEGRAALDYLRRRGLTDATIASFGLGWSGEGRGALAAALARQGITVEQLIDAGLMRAPETGDGRPPYDLFFNRVMFPIRDRRGRTISFGGRTLGDAQPKYVNGPETALFSKRRSLYALDAAREGARTGAAVIVVEGYMDAIALHQAGFTGAVAPLGTALSAEQLTELWRLSPSPVLCFDGDKAGARAALRAAETALPLLAPDHTLRFAALPAGEDPDSLLRRPDGRTAVNAMLNAATPFVDALFAMSQEGASPTTPEQRAALRIRLEESARRIPDRALADEYRRALLDRFFAAGRARMNGARGSNGRAARPAFGAATLAAPRARGRFSADAVTAERGRILVAILLRHPDLLHDVGHAFEEVPLAPPLDRIRAALFGFSVADSALDSVALMNHLSHSGLAGDAAQALSAVPLPLPACAAEGAMPAEAEIGWWHYFGLIRGADRLETEVAALGQELAAGWDGRTQSRLIALRTALNDLRRGEQGAEAEG